MNTREILLPLCAAFAVLSSTANGGEAPPPAVVATCSGGALEAINMFTFNGQSTKAGASWEAIPSTFVSGGPSGPEPNGDLYKVTFSAQANNSVAGTSFLVQAEASVNAGPYVALHPVGPNTFHQGNSAETHTMTWCGRLTGDLTDFRISWWKVGGGSAIVDDYVIEVERFD